jgi:hypothetical protein
VRQIWATLAALGAASVAGAQTPAAVPAVPEEIQVKFTVADADGSGGLTLDEAIRGGYAAQRFPAVDRDNDRIVTLAEIATFLADRAAGWRRADANNDGVISRQEAEASPELRSSFSSADRDADGVLRQQEHAAWSQTSLFQNTDLPYVVPNIFNKRF